MSLRIIVTILFGLLTLVAHGGDWSVVAAVDARLTNDPPRINGASEYIYSLQEIPASALAAESAERKIIFGNTIILAWTGALPDAQYKIWATFLSDSADRVLRTEVNGRPLEEELTLPQGKPLECEWLVPVGVITNDDVTVTIRRVSGANAVLSRLVILSEVPQTLSTPPLAADVLREIEVTMPRLSPRPTVVGGVGRPVLSLDGMWKFNPAPPPNYASYGAGQSMNWSPITVPGEWVMQGFTVASNAAAAYWREFEIPEDWRGQRVKLRFDTVHSDCHVSVNGLSVGAHEGCFTPFELDITDAVRLGRNTLALAVKSDSVADTLASASQYAAHQLGGITRKAQLFALPLVHIAAQTVETLFDERYENATLCLTVSVADESLIQSSAPASLRVTLLDGEITVATATHEISTGAGKVNMSIPVTAPQKWDSEHPYLYSLKTELLVDGEVAEAISQRVGFRQMEVRGTRLFVNGAPVKLRGVCRHEVNPIRGRSLTTDDWREDVELFRKANVNYIRTSHYPPSEEFLDLCDQYGFFVECEAPLCWVEHGANSIWQSWNYQDLKFFPYLLRANYETLAAHRHHPSVIIWSLANESRWSPLFAEVNQRMKQADPTRPTSFHDQCWGDYNNAHSEADIAVYHYPGPSGPAKCDTEKRPVLFGEYCHVECYNRRELAADPGVRDEWGRGFARMNELMYQHEGCLGGAIWAGIDDVFCLPDGQFVGYGMWGAICDGWRREKPEFWHVKMTYSPVHVGVQELPLPTAEATIRVPVENRYNVANLSEVAITWDIDGVGGKARVDVPARQRGEIVIQPQTVPKDGDELHLVFLDPRGFICSEARIVLGKTSQTLPEFEKTTGDSLAVSEDAGKVKITGSNASYTLDRKTGQFLSAVVRGRPLLTGGPALMILPLKSEACEPVDLGVWKPLNNVCQNWRAESVSITNVHGGVEVTVKGSYDEAAGSYAMRLDDSGQVEVRYAFVSRVQINPRQWGLVFFAPRDFNRLDWQRQAQWTVYPDDHIGRPEGMATARAAADPKAYATQKPGHAWSLDATELGGNDFTSTKRSILKASLGDGQNRISVTSEGSQSVRAFQEADHTGLLVADFDTGGGDGFFASHLAAERGPLNQGSTISGTIILHLDEQKPFHSFPK